MKLGGRHGGHEEEEGGGGGVFLFERTMNVYSLFNFFFLIFM